MKHSFVILTVSFLLLLTGCQVKIIRFFEVNPDVPELKEKYEGFTLSFRSAIEDSFLIESKSIGKTAIVEFKKTLTVAFRNTFGGSFKHFSVYNNFSLEGISLVIADMKPVWYEKSESSMGSETAVLYNYKIILYKDGQFVREIEKQSRSVMAYRVVKNAVSGDMYHNTPVMVLRNGLEETCKDIYNEVMENVLKSSVSGNGTGFLISPDGYVITNAHVVESSGSIQVKINKNGQQLALPATIVAEDKSNDLAILKIEAQPGLKLPFALRSKGLETGENVFVLGYPLVQYMGEEIKLTNGVISSKSGYKGNASSYQISASAQPGNSGSPVFDSDGNLIGVVNSKIMGAEGVTYVIKPNLIKSLFYNADIELMTPEKSDGEGLNLAEQTRLLSPFIYIIHVEK